MKAKYEDIEFYYKLLLSCNVKRSVEKGFVNVKVHC